MRTLLLVMMACAPRSHPRAAPTAGTAAAMPSVVIRGPSYLDPELASRGLGRLDVVVRSVERPTESLQGADVAVLSNDNEKPKWFTSDEHGIVHFDSLPVGSYQVVVRRPGRAASRISTSIVGGCRTDLEVYVVLTYTGLDPMPATMPGRSTVTTCNRAR